MFLRAVRDFVSRKNDSKELTIGIVNSKINAMVNELTAIEKGVLCGATHHFFNLT